MHTPSSYDRGSHDLEVAMSALAEMLPILERMPVTFDSAQLKLLHIKASTYLATLEIEMNLQSEFRAINADAHR